MKNDAYIIFGKEFSKDAVHKVVILKGIIAVGLVAGYFLPAEHAWKVGILTNLVWLYKC